MAISIQTSIYSKPGAWNLDHHSSASSDLGALPNAISSQYLLPVSEIDSSNLFPYFHNSADFSQSSLSASMGQKSRVVEPRLGAVTKSTKMRNSTTALDRRTSAPTDISVPPISAEKKRNKLGYHRTSVACGHCRRRKIRCISASGDKRCSNCIRLKKECKFFPVDQQSQASLGRRDPKVQSTARRISDELSLPSTISDQVSNMSTSLPYSPLLSAVSVQNLGCSQIKHQPMMHFSLGVSKGIRSMGDFTGYSSGTDTNSWIAPDTLSMSEPSQEAPPYWVTNSQESSLTSSYSPFNSCLEAPSLPSWPAGHIDPGFREDLTWSPQAMPSYNSLQDINSPHQYAQYNAATSNSMNYHVAKRPASQSSGLYPAPILSSVNQIAATEQGDDRPRHLNMTNIPLHLPISPWEHPFSYQKHLSPSSKQCTSWEEGHGDAIPLHVEAVHESLSSFTDDTSGREIYFPLNQER